VFVYVGTFTERPLGRADGIYVLRFDVETGALTPVQTVSEVPNPAFLSLDAHQRRLYAANEVPDGGVSAFARDARSGTLRLLNRQSSHGSGPCYVSVDASGRFVLVANYAGGTIAALPIGEDGRLDPASDGVRHQGSSINPRRQEAPHPHMIASTPDGHYVLATDLGTDQILVYRLEAATGQLLPNDTGPAVAAAEPGAGPRHFAFAPNGRVVYVINELASTLTVFAYDGACGELIPLQTVTTLPAGFTGESWCAHVAVSPDGRFVYGSNRGHDSIAIWAVDDASGKVTPVWHEPTQGKVPRNFALDPTGAWLLAANQESDSIVVFRRDAETGKLAAAGEALAIPSPVCVVFAGE
jgi:6-phosphogluconolactonase